MVNRVGCGPANIGSSPLSLTLKGNNLNEIFTNITIVYFNRLYGFVMWL